MHLSQKIKNAIEGHEALTEINTPKKKQWSDFTRTQFNQIARIINRKISREVLINSDLIEMYLIIGKQKLEKDMLILRCNTLFDFLKYLGNLGEHKVFNWVSGKTLQSYWNGGAAKYIKINSLLCFLKVPFSSWDIWLKEIGHHTEAYAEGLNRLASTTVLSRTSMAIIKTYYTGNYYLYYQKTDGSRNIIKTPFVIQEQENGQVIIKSVSEGHRYKGKVSGIRDGCLYITNQNLDFDEMEQYVFNIGLETKPEVLFGVSTTVSVKNRQAVALKNILVKQKNNDPAFENIDEIQIPFNRKYSNENEEAIIVNYLRRFSENIIIAPGCCSLNEMK